MANTLDSNGLSIDTRNEILANMQNEWQEIMGGDVNFESNTSDGQILQIFAQMCADYSEVIREVYNSFFPNKVGATVQDERYAINGIFRKEGSYPSQCTSPKHPASCIEPGLATRFIHDIIHVSMPFSQIFPPSSLPIPSLWVVPVH